MRFWRVESSNEYYIYGIRQRKFDQIIFGNTLNFWHGASSVLGIVARVLQTWLYRIYARSIDGLYMYRYIVIATFNVSYIV